MIATAPILQEHEHHDGHQDDRVAQRLEHLVDALARVGGRVEADFVTHALGKRGPQLFHLRQHPVVRFQRVGVGHLKHDQQHRGLAVEHHVEVFVLGGQLDAADVADAHDPTLGRAFDDDVFELLDVLQAAQRAERDLGRLVAAHGRRADHARGHLGVLLANGGDDVAGGHVAGGQPLGIDPDANAVVALAHDVDVAHSVDAKQLVADLHQGEVAQVQLVVAPIGRNDRHAHQHVGRPLGHAHAGLFDHVRQRRQRQADAVLHEHLGHVEIDAVVERDRQAVAAVVVAGGGHVEHAFHAVDLLLDGRGHAAGDPLGAGAGIVAHDRDVRRGNRRKLRQRQVEDRDSAGQRDHDRQHRGEDRPIDEESRKHGPKTSPPGHSPAAGGHRFRAAAAIVVQRCQENRRINSRGPCSRLRGHACRKQAWHPEANRLSIPRCLRLVV